MSLIQNIVSIKQDFTKIALYSWGICYKKSFTISSINKMYVIEIHTFKMNKNNTNHKSILKYRIVKLQFL